MALETLKGIPQIGPFPVGHINSLPITDEDRDAFSKYIVVNHATNCVAFTIQNGPIKEVGINGCQVESLIQTAQVIIAGLNEKFPCEENERALAHIEGALQWIDQRRINREKRGVEGLNKA